MTRITGPDCAVMCNLKYIYTQTHTHTSQIEEAVSSSWAALAAEEDPQGRGIGTPLVEAGAERGGGDARGGGTWGRGG